MQEEIPFNIGHRIPEGQLRAVPDDLDEMHRAVDWLVERATSAKSAVERARMLGLAGGYAGIVGDVDRASRLLREAIELAQQAEDPKITLTLHIRLADAIAGSGRPQDAAELLETQILRIHEDPTLEPLRDFAHQHLGKALIEAGEIQAGIDHLEHALRIRQEKGDPDLRASTEQGLRVARESPEKHGT